MRVGKFVALATKVLAMGVLAGAPSWAAEIEGYLTNSDPGNPLTVMDDSGARLSLPDGPYDALLSQESRSYSLTHRPSGLKVTVSVPSGFPGQDLRQFFVPASAMGQDFDMRGDTEDLLIRRWVKQEREACVYYDANQCRAGCAGWQLFQNTYEVRQRVFVWDFLEPAQAVVRARFQGNLERRTEKIAHLPMTACMH